MNFGQFTIRRERYWDGKVRSLWPHDLNSECPRNPEAAWVKRVRGVQDHLEINEDEGNETGRQVLAWLHRVCNEGGNAFNELKNWNEAKLRRTLDWIQKNVPAGERKAYLTAVEIAFVEETEIATGASF